MSVCCVCRNKREVGSTVVHHAFPSDSTMAARWCEILRFDRIPTQYAKVCGEHFEEDDYTTYDGTTRNKTLKIEAVPSKNLGNLSQKTDSPDISTSAPTTNSDNMSDHLSTIEKILSKYATPQSIEILHDSDTHKITISYSPVLNPVAPKEQQIICTRCNAIFKTPLNLQLHEKICRDKLKPYQCAKCNATFESIAELRMHKTCDLKRPHESESEEVSDNDEAMCPKKACKECPSFVPVSKMKKHYAELHQGENAPFSCAVCNLKLDSCNDLCKHLQSHSVEQLRSVKEKYPTGFHYSSIKHEYFECCLCGDVFKTEPACSIHQNTHLLKRVRCPVCQDIFNTKEEFVNHLKKHTVQKRD